MATPDSVIMKPRRRWPLVLGIVGAVVAAVVIALVAYSNVPNEAANLAESVSAESRERNTLIATSLVVGGIEESFVDVTPERVYVLYALPNGSITGTEPDPFTQEFVLGAAARGAPSSQQAVIAQSVNGTLRLVWKVEVTKVTAFLAGELSEESLMAAIEKTSYEAPAS